MSGFNSDPGSSKSTNSQTQTQETQDNRIVGAEGSVNLVASRSTLGNVNIQQTDFGTVSKAFDFAAQMALGAANESAASSASVKNIAASAMQSVQDAYKGSSDAVAGAFETAKAGEQKIMVAAALAIVGIVAFKSFGGKA